MLYILRYFWFNFIYLIPYLIIFIFDIFYFWLCCFDLCYHFFSNYLKFTKLLLMNFCSVVHLLPLFFYLLYHLPFKKICSSLFTFLVYFMNPSWYFYLSLQFIKYFFPLIFHYFTPTFIIFGLIFCFMNSLLQGFSFLLKSTSYFSLFYYLIILLDSFH